MKRSKEYHCSNCGDCCQNISLFVSPEELKKLKRNYPESLTCKFNNPIRDIFWMVNLLESIPKEDKDYYTKYVSADLKDYKYRCICYSSKHGCLIEKLLGKRFKPAVCAKYGVNYLGTPSILCTMRNYLNATQDDLEAEEIDKPKQGE